MRFEDYKKMTAALVYTAHVKVIDQHVYFGIVSQTHVTINICYAYIKDLNVTSDFSLEEDEHAGGNKLINNLDILNSTVHDKNHFTL